jgi:hypothetical protein
MSELEPQPPAGWSAEQLARYRAAVADLSPTQVLARSVEHRRFVIRTVALVGTALAVAGAAATALVLSSTTAPWDGVPLVALGALLTSAVASAALFTVFLARRPRLEPMSMTDPVLVKTYFDREIARSRKTVGTARALLAVSAFLAALTALVAAITVLTTPDELGNQVALTTTAGEGGTVDVELGGSVTGLHDDELVRVAVVSDAQEAPVLSTLAYPDAEGEAALTGTGAVPAGGTTITAYVEVYEGDEDEETLVETFVLIVTHPLVPEAAPATAD